MVLKYKYCPKCGWGNPDKFDLTHCENELCGKQIPPHVKAERWKGAWASAPERAATLVDKPLPSTSAEAVIVTLRFPWNEVFTVRDKLRIGRFDPSKPGIIENWDPVSQALARKLESPPASYRAVSRLHAEIYIEKDKVFIVDSKSTFGTKLTGGGLPDVLLTAEEPYELTAGRMISLDQEQPALVIGVVAIRGGRNMEQPGNLTTRA